MFAKNEVVAWEIRIILVLLGLDILSARLLQGEINRIGLVVIVKGLSSIYDIFPFVIIVAINVDNRIGVDSISMRGCVKLDVALS